MRYFLIYVLILLGCHFAEAQITRLCDIDDHLVNSSNEHLQWVKDSHEVLELFPWHSICGEGGYGPIGQVIVDRRIDLLPVLATLGFDQPQIIEDANQHIFSDVMGGLERRIERRIEIVIPEEFSFSNQVTVWPIINLSALLVYLARDDQMALEGHLQQSEVNLMNLANSIRYEQTQQAHIRRENREYIDTLQTTFQDMLDRFGVESRQAVQARITLQDAFAYYQTAVRDITGDHIEQLDQVGFLLMDEDGKKAFVKRTDSGLHAEFLDMF